MYPAAHARVAPTPFPASTTPCLPRYLRLSCTIPRAESPSFRIGLDSVLTPTLRSLTNAYVQVLCICTYTCVNPLPYVSLGPPLPQLGSPSPSDTSSPAADLSPIVLLPSPSHPFPPQSRISPHEENHVAPCVPLHVALRQSCAMC